MDEDTRFQPKGFISYSDSEQHKRDMEELRIASDSK